MKILLAVDGSAFGDDAAAEVARRPWPAGTHVRVLSVAEPPAALAAEPYMLSEQYYVEAAKAVRERARGAVTKAADELKRHLGGRGVEITSDVISGPAGRLIVEEAEKWGADLIVVGSHGHGFWGRLLLGSVSQAVAAHAKCSVEIVRRRAGGEAGGR